MNGNSDNHKPLSPEELFRLLETKNEGALSGDDLDDFEREALEGFSAHTSVEKARELTEEVHQRIHEQIDETRKKRPVARIVWFGAAASVIVALIISTYFITHNVNDTNNLALNNKDVADEAKQSPAAPALEEAPATPADELQKQEKDTKPPAPPRETSVSQVESSSGQLNPGAENRIVSKDGDFNGMKNDAAAAGADFEKSKDEVKISQGQSTKGYDLKLAETQEQESRVAVDGLANGTVAANKALVMPKEDQVAMTPVQKENAGATDERYRNPNMSKASISFRKGKKVEEKEKEEEKAGMYEVTTATGSAKTEDYKGPLGNVRAAYYAGGEQKLKATIMTWFSEHQYEAPKGNYNIRMKVGADGSAQVLEVKGEKNQDEKVLRHLEECLKSLKNWNPAINGREAVESETTFLLSF